MGRIGLTEIILILLVVVLLFGGRKIPELMKGIGQGMNCLLYTSDAADDLLCVDLGGRRIIKKKK